MPDVIQEQLVAHLSLEDFNGVRLVNRNLYEICSHDVKQRIINAYNNSSFSEHGFYDDPESDAVKLITACEHDRLKNAFRNQFWQSRPSIDVLINWLENAPSSMFIYPGSTFRHLMINIHNSNNIAWFRLGLERMVRMLEAMLAIRNGHRQDLVGEDATIASSRPIEMALVYNYRNGGYLDEDLRVRADNVARHLGCEGGVLVACCFIYNLRANPEFCRLVNQHPSTLRPLLLHIKEQLPDREANISIARVLQEVNITDTDRERFTMTVNTMYSVIQEMEANNQVDPEADFFDADLQLLPDFYRTLLSHERR